MNHMMISDISVVFIFGLFGCGLNDLLNIFSILIYNTLIQYNIKYTKNSYHHLIHIEEIKHKPVGNVTI